MRNVLEAIWWWTRVAVLAVVGVYVLALLFNNSGQTARLWYWFGHESDNTPIITIVVVSFLAGGIVTLTGWALLTATIGYRRTRDARRERLAIEQRQAIQQKAARLRVKPQPIARPRVVAPPARVFTVATESSPQAAMDPVKPNVAPAAPEPIVETPATPIVEEGTDTPTAVRSDTERPSTDEDERVA